MKKRVLSWLLCLCMTVSLLSGAVWAEGEASTEPADQTASEQPAAELTPETQEFQALEEADTSGLTVAKAMVKEGSSERVPAAERQATMNMSVGESGGYFFFYNGVQLDDLLNESAPKLTAAGSARVSPRNNVTSWCYIHANSVGQGTVTYTNGTDTGSITLQVSPKPFAFYDSTGAGVMDSEEHMVDTIDWTPGQDPVVLYALLGDPTATVGEMTPARLDEEGNPTAGLTFSTETLTEGGKTIGYKVTLTEVSNYIELHLTVPVNGENRVARVDINYKSEDGGEGDDGPAVPDEPEVETVPAYDPNYAYGETDTNYSCYAFLTAEEAEEKPYLLYCSPSGLNENGNLPLKQIGMSAYAADRTYYLFSGTEILTKDTEVTVDDGGMASFIESSNCFEITFPCVPRASQLTLRVTNDEKTTRLDIDQAKPENETSAELTFGAGDHTQTYYVGVLSLQAEEQVTFTEGLMKSQTLGGPGIDFPMTVGVLSKVTREDGKEEYRREQGLENLALTIHSAELYSYVGGVLTSVGANDPYVEPLERAKNVLYVQTKDTASDCGYYVLVTFTLDGQGPKTFFTSLMLNAELTDTIDLTNPAVLRSVDTDGDNDVSLDELHALFDSIDDMDAEVVDITLPEDTELEGTLVLDTKIPVRLDCNGGRLNGSILVDVPDVEFEVSNLDCYSVVAGIDDPADIGVYGLGKVSLEGCAFNGYTVAVESFKHDGQNGTYQKRVDDCLIAGCGIGILIDQHTIVGSYSYQYAGNTFFNNQVAIQIEDLEQMDEVIHLPRFRVSAFIDNGKDLVTSERIDQMIRFYRSGFYTSSAERPEQGDLYDADLVAALRALQSVDLTITGCKINGYTANDSEINAFAIIAPQSSETTIWNGWVQIDESEGPLMVWGEVANVDNSETGAFSVENFTGTLDMQQPDGSTYDHIATWDFSKEDEAQ